MPDAEAAPDERFGQRRAVAGLNPVRVVRPKERQACNAPGPLGRGRDGVEARVGDVRRLAKIDAYARVRRSVGDTDPVPAVGVSGA